MHDHTETDNARAPRATEALNGPTEPQNHPGGVTPPTAPATATSGQHSPHGEAATDDARAAVASARKEITDRLWWQVPSANDAEAKAGAAKMLDDFAAAVLYEGAAELDRIADKTEARVAAHYGPTSGIGPGSAELVREAARTLRSVAAERYGRATAGNAPDFFQPGHSYTHRDGSTFRCVALTTHPDGSERVALGWHTDTAGWTFIGVRNINHWNHEYDGVQPPAEAGEVSA
ncbi:hypothetical protein ACWEQ7_04125 [Streptomyces sp. NPDC004069]